jgi:hypothetical protein
MKVMRSSWFVVYLLIFWKLLELDWYVIREEPNNTMNMRMNTIMLTMNNVTYYLMISSYLGRYKSINKYNDYILEDIRYNQQRLRTYHFDQTINIYPSTICIYKKHPMYLSGLQVRRERTGRHAPQRRRGHR